jgi:4-hydroxybenzoate polyprenyltransferase
VKNGLVFAPLIFAQRLLDSRDIFRSLIAFVALSAVSSVAYVVNDIMDRAADRTHPEKRRRPLASGELKVKHAVAMAIVLGLFGAGASVPLGLPFLGIVCGYLALQLLYSTVLKKIVIVDVITLAVGFVLRALAGGIAIRVAVSPWLIVITFLLALFLALAKRRSELASLGPNAGSHRRVLGEYNGPLIDQMMSIATGATLVAYMIYTTSPEVEAKLGTHALYLTVPTVTWGIFRYLYLVQVRQEGGDPTRLLFRDRQILLSVLIWIASDIVLLYL